MNMHIMESKDEREAEAKANKFNLQRKERRERKQKERAQRETRPSRMMYERVRVIKPKKGEEKEKDPLRTFRI